MERRRSYKAVVLLIGALFAAYGVYALVQSRANPQWLSVAVAGLSVLGGLGLLLGRPWSRFCIYIVSVAVAGAWAYYTVLAVPTWPYRTLVDTIIALLPGMFLLVIAAGSSFVVTRHFSVGAGKP
jgi:hypothetical protein